MNRTSINRKADKEITRQAVNRGIIRCEICGSNSWLTRMHRHKRLWYYDKPDELLWDYKQWIIACIKCHDHYEDDREGTEKIFSELRGEENE